MGTEGDVVWVGPVNILLHNVQRWVAYRIVGGKVPENNRKKKKIIFSQIISPIDIIF
jgi:hypothetical protein